MSKRKNDYVADSDDEAKRQRRRTRSSSEPPMKYEAEEPPLRQETEEPEKREVLKRLFGRCISINTQNIQPPVEQSEDEEEEDNYSEYDENDDPLLDIVPVNMDPEQLGFLICAQETLRYLYTGGVGAENPMFVRLRSHLLRGIAHIAAA